MEVWISKLKLWTQFLAFAIVVVVFLGGRGECCGFKSVGISKTLENRYRMARVN